MISIRSRLARSIAIGAGLLLITGGLALDRVVHLELSRRSDASLLLHGWSLANALRATDGRIELEALNGLHAAVDDTDRPLFFEVWREDGTVAARSPTLRGGDLPHVLVRGDDPVFVDFVLADHRSVRAAAVAVRLLEETEEPDISVPNGMVVVHKDDPPTPRDIWTIVVAEDLHELEATMERLRRDFLGVALVFVVAGTAYVSWVLRRDLLPLDLLAKRTRAINERTLKAGVGDEPLPPELATIRSTLNDLLSRLAATLEREQRFTAAVAHELRTPLAEIRTMIEVAALDHGDPQSEETLSEVLHVAKQMQTLIDSLLLLKRFESGDGHIARERTSLHVVVEDALDDEAAVARRREVRIECAVSEDARIETHSGMLSAMVRNLVSNALTYAPERTSVRIDGGLVGDRFRLSFSNQAPDLSVEDMDLMFEPFWRKEGSSANTQHFGLGLSLSRAMAQALGCELRAELFDAARVVITLEGAAGRPMPAS